MGNINVYRTESIIRCLDEVEFMKHDSTGKIYTRRFSRDEIDPITNARRQVILFDIIGHPGSGRFFVQYRTNLNSYDVWKSLGYFKSVQAAKKAILAYAIVEV